MLNNTLKPKNKKYKTLNVVMIGAQTSLPAECSSLCIYQICETQCVEEHATPHHLTQTSRNHG